MKRGSENRQWDRTENFSKFKHPLWDLGLIHRFLKKREEFLVFFAMLRYSDFHTGECVVFIETLMHETGVKHPTQVQRIQAKIVRMGAFWRPEGKKGFKLVNGKWVKRYFRSTGKRIISHALENDLISEETLADVALRHVEQEIKAEALAANAQRAGGPSDVAPRT